MHDREYTKSIPLRLKMAEEDDVTEAIQEEDTSTDYLKEKELGTTKTLY